MIKALLRKLPFFPLLRSVYRKAKSTYRKVIKIPLHPIQATPTAEGYKIVSLGSDYGGWSFVEENSLNGCTIISAGLGEDASFDIEFAARYGANVIIVDPTPRAVTHFNEIYKSLGKPAERVYSHDGCQPISAYDLSELHENSLLLVTKALWNENTTIKFYEPKNPKSVSHSIINHQNNYSNDTKSIEVDAVTLSSILSDLNLNSSDIPLMKLDIEGAEIEVLKNCMLDEIYPRQILVEYDELGSPSTKGFGRVTEVDQLLKDNSYELINTDGHANFLYYQRDF